MSHSSTNTTVINNTNVVINIINANVERGKFPGLKEVPSGSPAAAVEQQLQKGLESALAAEWKSAFPSITQDPDSDTAFLIGPALLTVDMKVPNAVDAINTYLNSKGIVASDGFAENVVHTALLQLIQAGGLASTTSGTDVLGPLQKTDWALVTAPGKFGAGDKAGTIIAYSFTAASV